MRSPSRLAIIVTMLAGQSLVAAALAQSPDDGRIQCRDLVPSGTRLPQPRVCKTRAEWRALEKQRELDRNGEIFAHEEVIAQRLKTNAATPR